MQIKVYLDEKKLKTETQSASFSLIFWIYFIE